MKARLAMTAMLIILSEVSLFAFLDFEMLRLCLNMTNYGIWIATILRYAQILSMTVLFPPPLARGGLGVGFFVVERIYTAVIASN